MEVPDDVLFHNRDWDPSYLRLLFNEEFNDFAELWKSNVADSDVVTKTVHVERETYSLTVEDISLDDETLCSAVDKIEEEYCNSSSYVCN